LPGVAETVGPHLPENAGKEGRVPLLDRDDLGGRSGAAGGPDRAVAEARPYDPVWGAPPSGAVMASRYRPDPEAQAVFAADMRAMLADPFLSQATAAGLFGWSFMDAV
jgi:hypothetical protein